MIKKLFVILMLFSINVFSQKFLFTENFSSGSLAGWKIYDETPSHDGPSNWLINDGCLVQNSNVWAYAAGTTNTNINGHQIHPAIQLVGLSLKHYAVFADDA